LAQEVLPIGDRSQGMVVGNKIVAAVSLFLKLNEFGDGAKIISVV
jgi:hypothetical protein